MASTKRFLQQAVAQLTEEQARRVLDLIEQMLASAPGKRELTHRQMQERLAADPNFTLPTTDAPPFEDFEPLESSGIPASQLLVADRR